MTPNPARVLMTADAVGGIWTYALDLGRALRQGGTAVTLAVLGPGLDAARQAEAAERGLVCVDLGHAPEWLASGPESVARAGEALSGLARHCGAGLLHLNHPSLAAEARFPVPVLAMGHSCVATWWAAVRQTPLPPALAWQAALLGAGYRAADRVAVPTRAFAEATRAAYDLPLSPDVVHNGRAPAPDLRTQGPPARIGFTAGRLWDEGKGATILDAAAALTAVPIQAAGPRQGPNGAAIDLPHLETLGSLTDGQMRQALAARPVYLSAALYEPFGLSVLEAAQAGCALVLSDIPSFRELWNEAALFVAPGDAAGTAAALDRLVTQPPLRASLAEAARRRATRYGLDRQLAQLTALYAEMLASRIAAEPDAA